MSDEYDEREFAFRVAREAARALDVAVPNRPEGNNLNHADRLIAVVNIITGLRCEAYSIISQGDPQ